jgi:hypothetical protein
MRFQLQGHVQGRLSAWAIYIYCRSHLLNLSIKDAIDYSFYDAFDTIKSALIFLNDIVHKDLKFFSIVRNWSVQAKKV